LTLAFGHYKVAQKKIGSLRVALEKKWGLQVPLDVFGHTCYVDIGVEINVRIGGFFFFPEATAVSTVCMQTATAFNGYWYPSKLFSAAVVAAMAAATDGAAVAVAAAAIRGSREAA